MMDGLYAHAYEFYNRGRDWMKLRRSFVSYAFMILQSRLQRWDWRSMPSEKQFQKACDLCAVAFTLLKNDYRPVFLPGSVNY